MTGIPLHSIRGKTIVGQLPLPSADLEADLDLLTAIADGENVHPEVASSHIRAAVEELAERRQGYVGWEMSPSEVHDLMRRLRELPEFQEGCRV